MQKIGLALGAGGARGLAQIIMLEAFDELGIKPSIISGSSIGAIIGAYYAAGLSIKQMKEIVEELVSSKNTKFWEIHKKSDLLKMFDILDPGLKQGGIIKGDKFINFLGETIKVKRFRDLNIPLKITATNYWTKEEVIMDKGNLLKAIRASFSLPGLFAPVNYKNQLLIDGGMVNPLPYDIIRKECDKTVAIDVSAVKRSNIKETPSSYEILFSAFQIMQNSIVNAKIKRNSPDIIIKTNIKDIRVHEFPKYKYIFEESLPSKDLLKRRLSELIENK